MKPDHFIIRYAEIGIKGANKKFFQNLLIKNIKTALKDREYDTIKLSFSKVLLKLNSKSNPGKISEVLPRVFGIENFSPAWSCKTDYKDIEKTALALTPAKRGTFRITANRSWKGFALTSHQLNDRLGDAVRKQGLKVNLDRPKINIEVDILKEKSFVFTERVKGPGGLPVGCSGKMVSLISGGIDSPVASWMMMKRGCFVTFVHFYNETIESPKKVKDIVAYLCRNQPPARLYLVPFASCQKEVISGSPAEYRMILYRRLMLRIAMSVANPEKAGALVTGDSLGQVASQTLDNIRAIDRAVSIPVFRPLMGMDKKDIISLAERIGTYDLSIKPYQDCCSFMVPKHPVTKANYEIVKKIEAKIPMRKLVEKSVKDMQSLKIN